LSLPPSICPTCTALRARLFGRVTDVHRLAPTGLFVALCGAKGDPAKPRESSRCSCAVLWAHMRSATACRGAVQVRCIAVWGACCPRSCVWLAHVSCILLDPRSAAVELIMSREEAPCTRSVQTYLRAPHISVRVSVGGWVAGCGACAGCGGRKAGCGVHHRSSPRGRPAHRRGIPQQLLWDHLRGMASSAAAAVGRSGRQ
jgi:hypothetical protein